MPCPERESMLSSTHFRHRVPISRTWHLYLFNSCSVQVVPLEGGLVIISLSIIGSLLRKPKQNLNPTFLLNYRTRSLKKMKPVSNRTQHTHGLTVFGALIQKPALLPLFIGEACSFCHKLYFLFISIILLFCMHGCFAPMYVCNKCVQWPQNQERSRDLPGLESQW